jgi:hypothetical protein
MNEYNETPEAQVLHTEETSKFYLAELERVTSERDQSRANHDSARWVNGNLVDTIDKVTALVQAEYDKGGWDDDDEFFQSLCEVLTIETTEEYSVTITAKWDVTFTAKKGYDLGNLSVDINHDPDIDGDDIEDVNIGWVDVEVDEA